MLWNNSGIQEKPQTIGEDSAMDIMPEEEEC